MKSGTFLFAIFLVVLPFVGAFAQSEAAPPIDSTAKAGKPEGQQPASSPMLVGPPPPTSEQNNSPAQQEEKPPPSKATTFNIPKAAKTQPYLPKISETEPKVSDILAQTETDRTVKPPSSPDLETDTSAIRVQLLKKELEDVRAKIFEYDKTQAERTKELLKMGDYLLFGGLSAAALLCILLLWHLKKVENMKKTLVPTPSERKTAQPTTWPLETQPNDVPSSVQASLSALSVSCELLMGAGPRKNLIAENDDDYEMGEDVAGFISQAGRVVFWIMDGTSDSDEVLLPKIYQTFFSSRLLAQTLGWKIREAIIRLPNGVGSTPLLIEALKATQTEWEKSLSALTPESVGYLKNLLLQRHALYCSTTVLLGNLDLAGNLSIARIGDSGFVAYHGVPTIASFPKSNRQFASLILDKNSEPMLKFSPLQAETIESFRFSNVHSVLVFSDGIAPSTAQWLSQFNKPDFDEPAIRRKLLQLKSHSSDDKSLFLAQIK